MRRLKWPNFRLPKYESRLLFLQIITLEERRKIAQVSFVYNILKGNITSEFIMNLINIRIPTHATRITNLLNLPLRYSSYAQFEPINYMLSTFNHFYTINIEENCRDIHLIDFNMNIDIIRLRI